MKTLVTGGLGFVGSNLVDILINSGDEVFILDDLSSESSFIENQNMRADRFQAYLSQRVTMCSLD